MFGYPGNPSRETGVWVDVDLKGKVGGQLIQVESRSDQTVKAQPGFSGSPVWDHSKGEAAGLLQAAPFADEPERDAYLLPPLAVAQAWEQQFDYLLVPENPYRGLEPFSAEHAAVFFGRDADIAALDCPGAHAAGGRRGRTVRGRQVLAGAGRSHPCAAAAPAVVGGAGPAWPGPMAAARRRAAARAVRSGGRGDARAVPARERSAAC